jgi:prepilin-type processing-associated H-X9-DG protein
MICGFLCWIWPVSIAALVLGIIGVGKTRNSQLRGGGMAVTGIVLGGIGLILDPIVGLCLSIMLPAMHQARLAANGVLAQSNMQQIGVALQSYENQNQGAYPPDLETLISNQRLSPALFVYPGGSDTPADSVNALESGGHLSYVYLGGGKTDLSDTDRVVLYEDGRGHLERSVRGLNLLYADGHVDFESKANADLKINQTRNALKLPPVGN